MLYAILAAFALALLLTVRVVSPSNLYMNWTAVGFTPAGGSLQAIGKVTDVKIERGGNPERFKGDLAVYAQAVAVPDRMRTITVSSGDAGALLAFVQGTYGTFTATLADAINSTAAGGGGKIYALTNCVVAHNNADGAHAKFATSQVVFEGFAADGATDPLTVTPL